MSDTRKTQTDIAATMGLTQSFVSKLEKKNDDAIPLGDLRRYAAALDMEIPIVLQKRTR